MRKSVLKVGIAICLLTTLLGFKTAHDFNSTIISSDTLLLETPITPVLNQWQRVYNYMGLKEKGLSEEAFKYAWSAYEQGKFRKPIVAIADFSQSSCKKRFYIINFSEQTLLYRTHVAHGRNSGLEYARSFSNQSSSYQSSLGFYRTLGTYQGKHGLSLKLEGLEYGINHKAEERAIVMHGADYVSDRIIRQTGRLGRSQGCPAVSMQEAPKLISLLANGAGLFLYHPDPQYINASKFIAKNI